VIAALLFYVLFGFLPFGLAVYLFARAKRRVGHYIIAVLLLLIAVLSFFASVDVRRPPTSTLKPYPKLTAIS